MSYETNAAAKDIHAEPEEGSVQDTPVEAGKATYFFDLHRVRPAEQDSNVVDTGEGFERVSDGKSGDSFENLELH